MTPLEQTNNPSGAESTATAAISSLGQAAPEGYFMVASMKDPAVLFYSDNFLSGTMFMSDEQTGRYIRALCAQHLHGHLTKGQIDFIVKGDETVMEKFCIDENGKYYNNRLRIEVEKRQLHSIHQRENAFKRWGKNDKPLSKKKIRAMPSQCLIKALPLEDGNGDGNGNTDENTNNSGDRGAGEGGGSFGVFWLAYPRKVGKGAAERSWGKIKRPAEVMALIQAALAWQVKSEQWTKNGGEYIPHPATYLNQRRWEDEAPREKKWVSTDELLRQAIEEERKNGRAANQGH